MLVVKTMHIDFHLPAEFDDELRLETSLRHCHGARIEHTYRLVRIDPARTNEGPTTKTSETEKSCPLIVSGESVIACVDRTGRVRRLPTVLQTGITSASR